MPGSPTTETSVSRTASTATPGKIRQLTLAATCCGKAFSACPPSIMVATQVVRSMECHIGSFDRMESAAASSGWLTIRLMAAPVSPPLIAAMRVK